MYISWLCLRCWCVIKMLLRLSRYLDSSKMWVNLNCCLSLLFLYEAGVNDSYLNNVSSLSRRQTPSRHVFYYWCVTSWDQGLSRERKCDLTKDFFNIILFDTKKQITKMKNTVGPVITIIATKIFQLRFFTISLFVKLPTKLKFIFRKLDLHIKLLNSQNKLPQR